MENQNEKIQTNTEEDVILPTGWTGEGDFFEWAEANSLNDDSVNLLDASPGSEGTEETEPVPATDNGKEETAESPTDGGNDQPATQDKPEPQSTKIRFEANINHRKKSVELDQSELPELYEKAYAADKFRNKLNAKNAEMEQAETVSQLLGYNSVKEMLDAARTSYENSEIERLVNEKVHPDIAKDTVARRVREIEEKAAKNRKPVKPEEDEDAEPKRPERDFKPEVNELLKVYPEMSGKTLPKEVIDAALGGMSLVAAYAQYLRAQEKAEKDRLQKENRTLKQNAEAARRAPVRGVAKGGAPNVGAEDLFLKAFNSYGE